MERTVEDFIDDMLKHDRNWIAILCVSRAIRGGRWYEECKTILQDRGLMPKDMAQILKDRQIDMDRPKESEKPRYTTSKKH